LEHGVKERKEEHGARSLEHGVKERKMSTEFGAQSKGEEGRARSEGKISMLKAHCSRLIRIPVKGMDLRKKY